MKVSFWQLKQTSFNITGISAVERCWSHQNVNRHGRGRNVHILSLTLSGEKNFWTPDFEELIATRPAPSVALVPQGTPYFSQTVAPEGQEGRTICVEFRLTDDEGQPIYLTDGFLFWDPKETVPLIPLFRRILEDYLQPEMNYISLKKDVLQLLLELMQHRHHADRVPAKLQFLQPAIDFIRQNPEKHISVAELAKLCAVSESYFRASFSRFSGGVSVTKYRNILRIEKAQELLGSSLWTTAMIADQLGFYDVSHFYRVYKSVTGVLPKGREADGGV